MNICKVFSISFSCCVTVNIKIRWVTKNTLKKDKNLGEYPCFITINGTHNHSMNSAAALKQMRLLPDVREDFMGYFDLGE